MTQRTINLYDGLEALYYFDSDYFDGTTGEIKDKSGHGRHATANGGPTVGVNGPNDFEATSFDGGDDYFDVPDKLAFNEQSVAALVRPEVFAGSSGGKGGILSNFDSNGNGFILFQTSGFQWRVSGDTEDVRVSVSSNELDTDKWYVLVGTFDGERGAFYIDGEPVGTETGGTHTPSNRTAYIGINPFNTNNYFEGDIAVAARWSRALSQAEADYISRLSAPRRSL